MAVVRESSNPSRKTALMMQITVAVAYPVPSQITK